MSGPAPTPYTLRVVEGTRDVKGHRSTNPREWKPKKGRPKRPSLIKADEAAKAHYSDLAKLAKKVVTPVDGHALGKLAYLEARFEEMADVVRKAGFLVENPRTGNVRINPLMTQMSDLLSHITRLYREFGFTPAARPRIDTTEDVQPDGVWKDYPLPRSITGR